MILSGLPNLDIIGQKRVRNSKFQWSLQLSITVGSTSVTLSDLWLRLLLTDVTELWWELNSWITEVLLKVLRVQEKQNQLRISQKP
jgi:hypothetical protein